MGKLQARKAAITKRLDAVEDERILDAVEELLTGKAVEPLSDAEYAELLAIKARYRKGEEKGATWAEVKKRLTRELRA